MKSFFKKNITTQTHNQPKLNNDSSSKKKTTQNIFFCKKEIGDEKEKMMIQTK